MISIPIMDRLKKIRPLAKSYNAFNLSSPNSQTPWIQAAFSFQSH